MIRSLGIMLVILGLIFQPLVAAMPVAPEETNLHSSMSSSSDAVPSSMAHMTRSANEAMTKMRCHKHKSAIDIADEPGSKCCDDCVMACMAGSCATSCTTSCTSSGMLISHKFSQLVVPQQHRSLVLVAVEPPIRVSSPIYHPPRYS